MGHRVIITIAPGGKVVSRVEGIKGPSCATKTAWLDSLGQVEHTEDTPEAYLYESTEETTNESVKDSDKW